MSVWPFLHIKKHSSPCLPASVCYFTLYHHKTASVMCKRKLHRKIYIHNWWYCAAGATDIKTFYFFCKKWQNIIKYSLPQPLLLPHCNKDKKVYSIHNTPQHTRLTFMLVLSHYRKRHCDDDGSIAAATTTTVVVVVLVVTFTQVCKPFLLSLSFTFYSTTKPHAYTVFLSVFSVYNAVRTRDHKR